MKKVFISYRHVEPDQSVAHAIVVYLQQHGLQPFVDKQILIGTKWSDEIEQQIRMADYFIILVAHIQALIAQGSDMRRREAALLVGQDYADLVSTYRHGDFVNAVAFSPDGKLILTGSGDGTARLWRTDTGAPVGQPLRHEGSVYAVAFSPDGKTILAATQWWVHFSAISDETLRSTASRLLAGSWTGGYRFFLNEAGSSLQVALRSTADAVRIESLRLDSPEVEPLAGDPKVLLEEWQHKLALKFEEGKFVPLWPVAVDSGSRGGFELK